MNCIGNTTKIFWIVNGHLPTHYSNKLKIKKANNINFLAEICEQNSEVLNVKILRIVSKLCIGIGDTKFDQLMTLFSIDNGFYLGKTQRL